MARVVHTHPASTRYPCHLVTDLDFWDTRKILKGVAEVRRNFASDEFPAQVIAEDPSARREIERRLRKAVTAPPRHVVTREMTLHGAFEFDPGEYFPPRWSRSRMLHFAWRRLPLEQSALSSSWHTVRVFFSGDRIRVERVRREARLDSGVVRTEGEAARRLKVPSCF